MSRYLKWTMRRGLHRFAKYCAVFSGVVAIYAGLYYLRVWKGVTFGFADELVLRITRPAEELRRLYFVDLPFRRRIAGQWVSEAGHHLSMTRDGQITFPIDDVQIEVTAKFVGVSPWAGYQWTGLNARFDHQGEPHIIEVFIQEDELSIQRDEVIVSRLVGKKSKRVYQSPIHKLSTEAQ